ncbi:hypothetical protein Tco_1155126 [Tanacetum coccineum]
MRLIMRLRYISSGLVQISVSPTTICSTIARNTRDPLDPSSIIMAPDHSIQDHVAHEMMSDHNIQILAPQRKKDNIKEHAILHDQSNANELSSSSDRLNCLENYVDKTIWQEKSEGSEGFHQIIDFLTASHIKYALTENLTIYVSLIEQFWQTATASTLEDGDIGNTTTIDGKVKVVSEASIRRHLKLEDSNGISTLSTTEIFEQLALMGVKDQQSQLSPIIHPSVLIYLTTTNFLHPLCNYLVAEAAATMPHLFTSLRKLSFDEVKELFETTMKRVNTFTLMKSDDTIPKVVARSSKIDAEQELNQESSKRQKIGEGSEAAEESKDGLSKE